MNKPQLEAITEELANMAEYLEKASKMVEELPNSKYKTVLTSYLVNVGAMTFYLGLWIASVFNKLPEGNSQIPTDSFEDLMKKLMRDKENDGKSETGK